MFQVVDSMVDHCPYYHYFTDVRTCRCHHFSTTVSVLRLILVLVWNLWVLVFVLKNWVLIQAWLIGLGIQELLSTLSCADLGMCALCDIDMMVWMDDSCGKCCSCPWQNGSSCPCLLSAKMNETEWMVWLLKVTYPFHSPRMVSDHGGYGWISKGGSSSFHSNVKVP